MQTQTGYYYDIKINGTSVFNINGELISFDIYEGIRDIIPTCTLVITVPSMFFDSAPIVDGSIIDVKITHETLNINKTYSFGVYNIEQIKQSQYMLTLKITGVINFYPGYLDANILNSYCNSYEIFQKVAKAAKMKADIDTTNDKQLWVAGEKNIYSFLTYVSSHAYINNTSGMFWCLTGDKLLFKDVSNILKNTKDCFSLSHVTGYDRKDKTYYYDMAEAKIMSGYDNLVNGGYGGKDHYFDLLGYTQKTADSKNVISGNRMLNISKQQSAGLVKSYMPLDVGNFHPNYYNAVKQNQRILATLSTILYVTTQFMQPIQVGELINVTVSDGQEFCTVSAALSNYYIVSKMHIGIQREILLLDLELCAPGLNVTSPTVETY